MQLTVLDNLEALGRRTDDWDDLWLRSASHANNLAALLGRELARIDGVRLTQKVEANEVAGSWSSAAGWPAGCQFFFPEGTRNEALAVLFHSLRSGGIASTSPLSAATRRSFGLKATR